MSEPEHVATARAVYDHSAELYVDVVGSELSAEWEAPLDRAVLDAFVEMVVARPAGPVLDVGCGPGRVARYLADRGLDVAGVDLSPRMVEHAREVHPDLAFDVAPLTALPVADGSLAGAVSWFSIIATPPDELGPVGHELARVLRGDGLVLVAFRVGGGEADVRPDAWGSAETLTLYRHAPAAVAASLEAAGLELVATMTRWPQFAHEIDPQAVLLAARTDTSPPAAPAGLETSVADAEDPLAVVRAAELRLLDPVVRADPEALAEMLHADFVEIGASGRVWTRAEIVEHLRSSPDPGPITVEDLSARRVGSEAVVVTYTTVGAERRVRRSSWWLRSGGRWRVVFHQATPTS